MDYNQIRQLNRKKYIFAHLLCFDGNNTSQPFDFAISKRNIEGRDAAFFYRHFQVTRSHHTYDNFFLSICDENF